MPLIRIDLHRRGSRAEVVAITDAIHAAVVEVYGIPVRDRFHIVTQHEPGGIVAQDAGLGFDRSDAVVMIQIFTQRGRSVSAKQRLYARIARGLAELGVAGEDVFIGYVENGPEDWSFGFGAAQYVEGRLAVPES